MKQAFILLITSLLVITPSTYQERINDNNTVSAIGITQDGDVFMIVRGVKYKSEITDEGLNFKQVWEGEGIVSNFSEPDTGWKTE